MKNSRKPLRASFVVTVAASASLFGCSATVGPGPSDAAVDTSADADARVPPDSDPPPPQCPATVPSSGSACSLRESSEPNCQYTQGSSCPGSSTVAWCRGGRWEVAASTCNPPPPTCPTARPDAGTACPGYPNECPYPSSGCPSPDLMRCVSGRWQYEPADCQPPPPPRDMCPPAEPVEGAACDVPPSAESCNYGNCSGSPTTFARCNGGVWRVIRASCNPPPPTDAGAAPDA